MEEIWRDISGYDGIYQISSAGKIRNVKSGKILCQKITNGVRTIALSKHGYTTNYYVHRLVAKAFVANPENNHYVCHRNGNILDNRAENIFWCKWYKPFVKKSRRKKMKKELIKDVMAWHEETFPDATGSGQLAKLNEEVNEYIAIRTDDFGVGVEELADIFIVGCGLSRFSNPGALMAFGFVYTECIEYCKNFGNDVVFYLDLVSDAVAKKMETNRQRKWIKGNGEYRHMEA